MKAEEVRGREYLETLGFSDISFEPNGPKTAPDFQISGNIAVEITRLSQHYISGHSTRSLEQDAIPLTLAFRDFLHRFEPTFQPRADEPSWFVHFDFRRPVQKWPSLQSGLISTLNSFDPSDPANNPVRVTDEFQISFIKGGKRYDTLFRHGGSCDYNSGGFVIPELQRNIGICLKRKSFLLKKLGSYSARWLILVDHVSFGDWDPFTIDQKEWDRLVLLSPEGPIRSYEPSMRD